MLSAWRHQEISSGARTLTLAGLAGALLVVLRRVLRRRDRLEEERQRLERGLRDSQKAEAVGFLAASMAHDFNNVLGAIVGYAEIARTQVGHDERVTETLDGLLAASERARQLVRRVLTFDPHRSVCARRAGGRADRARGAGIASPWPAAVDHGQSRLHRDAPA